MERYLFTVYLEGFGNNVEKAWKDAIENNKLKEYTTPDEDDWEVIEENIDE